MSELLDTSVDDVAEDLPLDSEPSVLSDSTRQKLAALRAAKPAPAAEEEELAPVDSEAVEESAGADQAAEGEAKPDASAEIETAWKNIDEHVAKLEARAKEVATAESELAKYRGYRERFHEDPIAAFKAFVGDMTDAEGAELDRVFIETLTELNLEASGDLAPIERKYESLKRRAEREKQVRERRSKLEETRRAEQAAKQEEAAQYAKALEVVRGGVDLDRYKHLDFVDDWDAQLYARANSEYQRTGRVPDLAVLADKYDQELAAKLAAKLLRFKPAQESTQPAAKASNQKVATSKPAPRAKTEAANPTTTKEAWSNEAHMAETLAKFRRGFAR